ncbi:MAG TPA: hypothetical protein VE998_11070, partial [Terriglobales bacterium]|nr:hypothetical protein [Terriglobales bacterium]
MAEYRTRTGRLRVIRPARTQRPRRGGSAGLSRLAGGADPLLAFPVIFFAILVPHLPLVALPYFWDEAGYY